MRTAEPTLTRQELAIMKIVWRAGVVTVRDVYEALRTRRQVAYTTVMTVMNVLEAKGYLSKTKDNRAYVYHPTRPQQQVVRRMVREFVNRVFDGASTPLLLQLVRHTRLTEAERDELLRLIRKAK
jgi:BlaI family transcriptional regulator, penicillinase repressor